MNLTQQELLKVWKKAPRSGSSRDKKGFRKDQCGAWMKFEEYGNRNSDYGWEVDHIKPSSKGGKDNLSNLRPLHWRNNLIRSDGRLTCPVTSQGLANKVREEKQFAAWGVKAEELHTIELNEYRECYKKVNSYDNSKNLVQDSSQVVTSSASDKLPAWTSLDFEEHYRSGTGIDVTLHEIGLLQKVIEHAKTYNQALAGGGSIFDRVERQIVEESLQKGQSSFSTSFRRGTYDFEPVSYPLGHVPVHGEIDVNVVEDGEYLIINADIDYHFIDYFRIEALNGEPEGPETQDPKNRSTAPIIGTKAFYIRDDWSTHFEATVKKDSRQSKFL